MAFINSFPQPGSHIAASGSPRPSLLPSPPSLGCLNNASGLGLHTDEATSLTPDLGFLRPPGCLPINDPGPLTPPWASPQSLFFFPGPISVWLLSSVCQIPLAITCPLQRAPTRPPGVACPLPWGVPVSASFLGSQPQFPPPVCSTAPIVLAWLGWPLFSIPKALPSGFCSLFI